MKRKITNFLLLLALCVVGTSAFVSCKDYESDELGSMKTQIRELIIQQANDVKDMTGDIEKLQNQVGGWDEITNGTISDALKGAKATADNALTAANNANSRLDDLFGANNDLNTAVSNLQCVIDLMNRVEKLEEQINGDGQTNGIAKQLDDLKEQLAGMTEGWTGNIKDISDDAAKALALAKEDSLRLDAIEALLNNLNITDYSQDINDIKNQLTLLNGNYDTLKDDVANLKGDITTLKSDVAQAKQDAADAKAKAESLFEEAKGLIEEAKNKAIEDAKTYTDEQLELTKGELEAAYKAADAELEGKISALSTELKGLLNQLSDALYKLVTGVVIQGTENPVTGGINTPFDISTNLLAAYYGYNKTGVNVNFPIGSNNSGYASCYVRPDEAKGFTPLIAPERIAEANDLMMYENSLTYGGNAGKLYVTVNPSSADMSGLKFNLVDTQDNPAAGYDDFTLAKCNDKLMTFGWTRAAEENGFYVANANVKDPQAAKPDIDLGALKNVAKNVLDKISNPGNTRLDIVDGVTTIYKQINNKLVAYGVKIPGKYTDTLGVEHERNIYSQYKLAATAIKPLSFATLKDGLNRSIPMIPTLESKGISINMDDFTWKDIEEMDSIEVEIKLDEYPDIDNIKVNGKVVPEVDVTQPGVKVTKIYRNRETGEEKTYIPAGEEDKWYLYDVKVEITDAEVEVGEIDFSKVDVTIGTKTETLKVKVPMDQFNEIIRDINDQVGGMLGNVTDMVDKVNNAVSTFDSYINKVNSFIKKLNNKLRNPNALLQITMFYETADGSYAQLNAVKSKAMASRMKLGGKSEGAIILIPSSYTAEMFAPALKKYIAVTSAPSAAAQEYANKGLNMNQVIDGRCHNVVFQANEKGLYEIAYSAVDFHGFITTRKFYITVE